ncbi:hypothetical protein CkaCkLH20_05938 [Colletotrichum karsti]|uniref:Uncharacterized protein n=1 Tax=Colletotrichum karsti TaxID=1095194 RepID=A0A9P6I621_9PEZI|nr:uncharacterized protein CkaCkLH20_05938 [Colletotrichum karsti]KAF9876530.1 hypothetical protein CkaCkLH20_05938 [Colletotrichum karsti]
MICLEDEPEYYISKDFDNPPLDRAHSETFSSNKTMTAILSHAKDIAQGWLGEASNFTVVVIPKYLYDEPLREIIKDLGKQIGLDVSRLAMAPSAAAWGNGLTEECDYEELFLVYSLGLDDFEASVLEIDCGVTETLSSYGDTGIASEFTSLIQQQRGRSPEVESHLLQKTMKHVKDVIRVANLTKTDIRRIILTGEHANHPLVRSMLEELYSTNSSSQPLEFISLEDGSNAVTLGTSMVTHTLAGPDCWEIGYPFEVLRRAIGVGTVGGVTEQVFLRNSLLPNDKLLNLTTTFDNQTTISIPIILGGFVPTERNIPLIELRLEGIPPAPKGEPIISLHVEIFENYSVKDILLTANATLLDSGTADMIKDTVAIGGWFWNDKDMREVDRIIEKEEAERDQLQDVCFNRVIPSLGDSIACAVLRKDAESLDDCWLTSLAQAKEEEGEFARALCMYGKALPLFPMGHPELLMKIRKLWDQVKSRKDNTPVEGYGSAYWSPWGGDCYSSYYDEKDAVVVFADVDVPLPTRPT